MDLLCIIHVYTQIAARNVVHLNFQSVIQILVTISLLFPSCSLSLRLYVPIIICGMKRMHMHLRCAVDARWNAGVTSSPTSNSNTAFQDTEEREPFSTVEVIVTIHRIRCVFTWDKICGQRWIYGFKRLTCMSNLFQICRNWYPPSVPKLFKRET